MHVANSPASATLPAVRPRIRMSAERRRQQFIEAALQLFSTRGFRGTSTKAIADAAGASEALLFRHFPTKAALYTAILLEKADATGLTKRMQQLRRLAQRDDDEALVRFFVNGTLENHERDLPFARLMLYATLEGHELAATSHQLFGGPIFATLQQYVVRRQRAGAFRQGDPRLLALGIAAFPAYFSLVYRVLGQHTGTFAAPELIDLFTRMALDSIVAHPVETVTPKTGRHPARKRPKEDRPHRPRTRN
jgi:AcrR family transcriptional regulator